MSSQPEIDESERLADEIFLEHFGVMGMHWGVRTQKQLTERAAKDLAKADQKWASKINRNRKAYVKVYNSMADQMNGDDGELSKINNDPRFKGQDLSETGPLQREYYDEVSRTSQRILNAEAEKEFGRSPSGDFQIRFNYDVYKDGWPQMGIVHVQKDAQHADEGFENLDLTWSEDGHILAIKFSGEGDEAAIAQMAINLAMDTFDANPEESTEILVHYGVLGMHWGIRRDLDRLSDADLKATIERMRLEKQYNEIVNPKVARKFIVKHGDRVFGTAVAAVAGFAVKRYLDKKFGKGAGDAAVNVRRNVKEFEFS